jgi:hypothetical protein
MRLDRLYTAGHADACDLESSVAAQKGTQVCFPV